MSDLDEAVRFAVLSHHGVKGMKWGQRKKSGGGKTATTKFSKSPKRLSDEELQKRIKRLETEKKYNDLNSEVRSKGKRAAIDIIENSGKQAATKILTNVLYYVGKRVVAKMVGEAVGEAIFPKSSKGKGNPAIDSMTSKVAKTVKKGKDAADKAKAAEKPKKTKTKSSTSKEVTVWKP